MNTNNKNGYYTKLKKMIDTVEQYYRDYPQKLTQQYRDNLEEAKKQYCAYTNNKHKQWKLNNPEKARDRNKQWYKNNRDKAIAAHEKWRINNRELSRNTQRAYQNKRNKEDLRYNLSGKISSAIGESLRRTKLIKGNKNGRHWEDLVGYKLIDLIKRLKKTMPEGYTWNDVLNGKLHIDHKIPISAFNFTTPEHIDFKRCWALENLRLLPARENIIKSNKLYKPFQPCLKIS